MTKAELEDEYWHEFLLWCVNAPTGRMSDLTFWIDHRFATMDNFWEWMVTCKGAALNAASQGS